jgi:two-component system, OmpR family, response regulator RegX3
MRIAILEDDPSQLELLGHWVALAGHDPQRFGHGSELLKAMRHEEFDVLILDWNLPDLTGIDVLRRVRQGSKVPVIFCSSRDGEDDVVKALQEGAHDYLRKPIRRMELLARIETVARRAENMQAKAEDFEVDCFHVDFANRTITRDGTLMELTQKDFDLAVLFLRNLGRLLSRSYIREVVWSANGLLTSRSIDTHVSRIRTKLGLVPGHGWELKAVYAHGYRLERTQAAALLSPTKAMN